jgi:hypothetical protein
MRRRVSRSPQKARRVTEGFQAESLALYKQELAKGTEYADIFDKLVALGNAQSAEFRGIINWNGQVQ